ncbi:hypothetical protein M9H77_21962 [Catharanthus roseus]|uniref:Uncharacterized protein n=1 Tax=Catharanthus roseus TaxID=4058 RepID=A0ACC0AR57_CATRO|nr:hypothetical protein M9H77_21962 [Catharanthus roseus]
MRDRGGGYITSFASSTVANLGPGFDFLGCAGKKLSKNPLYNCAGIVALFVMKMLKIRSVGSGLGSTAASAAAAAIAINELFGRRLSVSYLVFPGLESEMKVSGYHADNVAPAIMRGFILIRSYDPLELIPLKFPQEKELLFVLGRLSYDRIVEPKWAPLIPGMEAVKMAAIDAGAFGCTISGAGSTAVA